MSSVSRVGARIRRIFDTPRVRDRVIRYAAVENRSETEARSVPGFNRSAEPGVFPGVRME